MVKGMLYLRPRSYDQGGKRTSSPFNPSPNSLATDTRPRRRFGDDARHSTEIISIAVRTTLNAKGSLELPSMFAAYLRVQHWVTDVLCSRVRAGPLRQRAFRGARARAARAQLPHEAVVHAAPLPRAARAVRAAHPLLPPPSPLTCPVVWDDCASPSDVHSTIASYAADRSSPAHGPEPELTTLEAITAWPGQCAAVTSDELDESVGFNA